MTCRSPLEAAREIGSTGKPLVYRRGQRPKSLAPNFEALELPCGQCRSCRLAYSREWAVRLMHECEYWEEQGIYPFFLTLTYDDDHLPFGGTLVKHHTQDFWKQLRYRTGRKLRYYVVGEYGSTCPDHQVQNCRYCGGLQRPHYHAIVFGWTPGDKTKVGERDGCLVYTSETIAESWKKGSHEFGSCTFESCAYVARYVMKKQTGKRAAEHYVRHLPELDMLYELEPEFAKMSTGGRCPNGEHMGGIGKPFYKKYWQDMYPADECEVPGRQAICKPPRYYDEMYKKYWPHSFEKIREDRLEQMRFSLANGPSLESRAKVEDARLALYQRS